MMRSARRSRSLVGLVVAAAAALLGGGCLGDDSDSGSGGTPATGTGSGGEVTVVQGVDPTTMDPLQQRETTTVNVLQHLYDPLVQPNPEDPRKFEPALAKSWKRVDDTHLRLELERGVTFSDGSSFDADDVKYTFDYLLGKLPGMDPAIASYQFAEVEGAKAIDKHTVEIVSKAPDPLLMNRLAALLIVPEGAVDKDPKTLASKPIGTGPYELVDWRRNDRVTMKARPQYFRGEPAIESVVFRTMPEASSALAALEAGEVDITTNVPADNVEEVEASGQATVERVPSTRVASVWLNVIESPELKDPDVRVALNHAVDVDTIVEQVMVGNGLRVATIVPPYFTNYDPAIKPIPYDPEKAKQLLAGAGLADGFELELMVPQGRYPFATEVSQAIASQLEEVGVKVELNTVDFGVFAEATQAREIPDGFFGAWGEEFFNPIDELNVAVVSGDDGFSWYSNKEIDRLTAEATRTLDPEKQKELVSEIQRRMLEDPPFIFLFAYRDLYGVSNRVDWKPRSDESIYMYEAKLAE
jgi:peptide/nickel transport system substrate-binding protein